MNEFIMVLIVLILVGYGIVFYPRAQYNQAPKIIWTYWEEPDHLDSKKRLSERANEAIRSWKQHNPNYEIIVLTKKTYQGYMTIPEEIRAHPAINPDYLRDLIKLWVLAERGGIWIDPEIVLTKPLDPWLFPKYAEFSGIGAEILDPRFMACNRGSIFIKRWRDEFSQIARFPNVDKYVESRSNRFIQDPITNVIQVAQPSWKSYWKNLIVQKITNVPLHF
jgi:hypothetical protein